MVVVVVVSRRSTPTTPRPYYPKARGCGLVIDSRALRRDGNRGNRAQIFRLDWHRYVPSA